MENEDWVVDEDDIVKRAFGEYFAKKYLHKFCVRRVQIIKFWRADAQVILKIKIKIDNLYITFRDGFHCEDIIFEYDGVKTPLYKFNWGDYDIGNIKNIDKYNTEWVREMIIYFAKNIEDVHDDIKYKFCYYSELLPSIPIMNKKRATFMLCNRIQNIFPPDIAKIIYFRILFFCEKQKLKIIYY